MTDINKQKFLAELGRLLTFMFDDERLNALAMYNRMFDEADDEQALLQLLVSPTRQAVTVARAYNAKPGKLSVHSEQRGEIPEEQAEYLSVIDGLRQEAINRGIIVVDEPGADQLSIFDQPEQTEVEPEPVDYFSEAPAAAVADAPESETEAPVEVPAQEPESAVSDIPARLGVSFDEDGNIVFEEIPQKAEPAIVSPAAEASEDSEAPSDPADSFDVFAPAVAAVDAVAAEPEEAPAEAVDAAQDDEESDGWFKPVAQAAPPRAVAPEGFGEVKPITGYEPDEDTEEYKTTPAEGEGKAKLIKLIPFILIGVPVTLLLLAALLVPSLASLAIAGILGGLGVAAISAALGGGFAMFANVLVVIGVAVILLGLALLFLWIFIWLIGGVMSGLVSSVITLGKKWCFEEVQA